jgi:hypothetical protein
MLSIRQLLTEAPEEVTLAKQPVSAAPTAPEGVKMSPTDFAPPAPAGGASAGLAPLPGINPGQAGPSTLNKEILNKQLLLSNLIVLKNIVATFEKQFEGEDFSIDDAKVYIHSFLQNLATQADNIAGIIGEEMGESGPVEGAPVEMPEPETLPEPPSASNTPKAPVETGEIDLAGAEPPIGGSPTDELSEPVPFEPSHFTNPTEAI